MKSKTQPKGRTLSEEGAEIFIRLNAGQIKGINALVASGLWGNKAAECVRRLIDDGLLRHAKP